MLNFLVCLLCFFPLLHSAERHVGIIVKRDFRGEISFAHRIKTACEHLNWKAEIIFLQRSHDVKDRSYDFVINIAPISYEKPNCKNYLAIFHPIHHFFNKKGELLPRYQNYDGYLLSYFPEEFPKQSKNFLGCSRLPYMLWYPLVHHRPYQEVDPLILFVVCCNWGNRYRDEKFLSMQELLSQQSYSRFYGNPVFSVMYPNSYQGEIPFDDHSYYELAAQAGVSLVIHSAEHNQCGIPSGRIFEAAAASTVIICDHNPFVEKHFGDCVLYIDTKQNGESIFQQIQEHMNWIWKNKAKALEKARKAYQIYQEKFLLEDQLLRLEKFHEELS